MFNHQLRLQAKRYLDPDFRAVLSKKFKALSLTADVASLQDARHLTFAARAFFGGLNYMHELRPSHDSQENVNSALRACFLALKAWAKILPALNGSPYEFEARFVMAELYSKCGRVFYYGFMHEAKVATMDYAEIGIEEKKNAFEWLLMRHKCHEYALIHMLAAEGCTGKNGLQMLDDQSSYDRISTAYENLANSSRALISRGNGVIGDEKLAALLAEYGRHNENKAVYAQKDKAFKAVQRDPAD